MRRSVFALDQRYVAYRRADPPKDRCAHSAREADRPRTTGRLEALPRRPEARHRRSGGRWSAARRRCSEELSPVENLRQAPAAATIRQLKCSGSRHGVPCAAEPNRGAAADRSPRVSADSDRSRAMPDSDFSTRRLAMPAAGPILTSRTERSYRVIAQPAVEPVRGVRRRRPTMTPRNFRTRDGQRRTPEHAAPAVQAGIRPQIWTRCSRSRASRVCSSRSTGRSAAKNTRASRGRCSRCSGSPPRCAHAPLPMHRSFRERAARRAPAGRGCAIARPAHEDDCMARIAAHAYAAAPAVGMPCTPFASRNGVTPACPNAARAARGRITTASTLRQRAHSA